MARKNAQDDLSSETRQKSIDEQVAAFLKAGGAITEIPRGKSGIEKTTGRTGIVLGSPPAKQGTTTKDNSK